MTDDHTMDKKVHGLLPSKCLGQDTNRPRQDGSGGNQTAKSSTRPARRRESPSGRSNAVKLRPEATFSRKPTPQKSKMDKLCPRDKRPRPRNLNNLQSVEESGSHKEPEMGSLQTPGSKKQNLNHLLNFHFAPRESRSSSAGSWRSFNSHPGGGWRTRHGAGGLVLRPKFNKENFLQANCQFLVKSTGDYSAHTYNPDLLVDWDLIEQIYIRVSGEFPNCPICLAPPVAAKMTRCGHIFCWPCLLHYLALSDKKFRKCPICYEPVYKHELKSVVATHFEDVHVGAELEMQLMFRKKGSFIAMPLMCKAGAAFDWESIFSKLLPVTPTEVTNRVIDREERELRFRYEEDKDCPEICFVEQAVRELDTRRSNTVECGTIETQQHQNVFRAMNLPGIDSWASPESTPTTPEAPQLFHDLLDNQYEVGGVKVISDDDVNCKGGTGSGVEDESSPKSPDHDDSFYFYQAVRGENIFLHPINMAMLWKSFGPDPASWPQVVQFRVVEKESVTMADDMRKRLRFLQHLPITTHVQLMEVDLKPPIVSNEILTEFAQQLEARKKRRQQRVRDERRHERKQQEDERKKSYHPPCPKFESMYDFPEYNYEDYETPTFTTGNDGETLTDGDNMNASRSTTDDDSTSTDRGCYSEQVSSWKLPSAGTGMSFAQIVSQKSAQQTGSRRAERNSSHVEINPQSSSHIQSDNEGDPEDYTPVPAYRMSMSDAIAKAIASVSVSEEPEVEASSSNSSGKKKGRKKGKVLFATGMGCYN